MYGDYNSGFPWIKFIILTTIGVVAMLMFAPGLKWKLLFSLGVPIGIYLALVGKSMKGVTPWARRGY